MAGEVCKRLLGSCWEQHIKLIQGWQQGLPKPSPGSGAALPSCGVDDQCTLGLWVCRNLYSGWEPGNVRWDQMHGGQGTTLWVTSLLLPFMCVLGIKITLSGVHSKCLYPPSHLVGPQGIFPELRQTCVCMYKYICVQYPFLMLRTEPQTTPSECTLCYWALHPAIPFPWVC